MGKIINEFFYFNIFHNLSYFSASCVCKVQTLSKAVRLCQRPLNFAERTDTQQT